MKKRASTLPEGTRSTLEPLRRSPASLVPPRPTKTFTVEIGALCDPISQQLKGLLSKNDAEMLDVDNAAITRCHIRGLITESQAHSARVRLLKKVQRCVARHCVTQTGPKV
jgi:hypothetical protein